MNSKKAAADRARQRQREEMNGTSSHWGDILTPQDETEQITIMFANINNIGFSQNDYKYKCVQAIMAKYNVTIMGLAELGVNWKAIENDKTIWERTTGWFENQRIAVGYNTKDLRHNKSQPGGTAILSQGGVSLRLVKNGSDSRKLGRWTWQKFRGKDNITTRIISVYVPIKSQSQGYATVYNQHLRALQLENERKDPIKIFWDDLWREVDRWNAAGENIIMMGDWNQDVVDKEMKEKFKSHNLIPAITNHHSDKTIPATQNRGRKAIDEIFVSPNIKINKSGFLEHGKLPSDHRAIWIQIDTSIIIGTNPDPPTNPEARRLKCGDPRTIKKYNTALNEYLNYNGFYPRLNELLTTYSNPLTNEEKIEYEKLDEIRIRGMKKAEKKCRKLNMGKYQWSVDLQKARDRLRYAKLSLSKKSTKRVSTRLIIRLSRKTSLQYEDCSVEELKEKIRKHTLDYVVAKKNSEGLRATYLEELARAKEENGEGDKASLLRNMTHIEKQRKTFRKIKRMKDNTRSLSTTSIVVTKENGQKEEISKKEELEREIISSNIKKYHQTENSCPFFNEPLYSDFGRFGEGPETKNLCQGKYKIPEGVDEYTADFLKECVNNYNNHKNEADLTRHPAQYRQSWKKMKEKTSSNGLHFGHYMAATRSDLITIGHWALADIPFKTGYSPQRWRNATDVMILKKAGLYDVEKLRTIVLYESDFNHNNKYLGKASIDYLQRNNSLAPEQYAVAGKKAIDHSVNRRLLFDYQRYQKESISMASCDLKSNYDRVAHTPATLVLNSSGIPIQPIISMFETIQDCQHTTRTAYGNSTLTYGGLDEHHKFFPQGLGQGNGFGPACWAIISSRLFNMIRNKGLGTKIQTPTSKEEFNIVGFGFVDDTDILSKSQISLNDPNSTNNQLQKTIDYWEGIAKVTGGAMDPAKCWFYSIFFEWKNGKWKYGILNPNQAAEVSIKDKDDVRGPLTYVKPDEAKEMLGVFLSPDGNNAKQVQILREKAQNLARQIRKIFLSHDETLTALNAVAMKSIEYPLPATTFSNKDCKSIMAPLLEVYLPKAGINRLLPRKILYGPKSHQGLGIKNIYISQNVAHIADYIEHQWKNSITGKFFKSCLESLQLEIGSEKDVFALKYDDYSKALLTESLVASMWKFISEHNISIEMRIGRCKLARKGDSFIMDHVYQKVPKSRWKGINKVRHYLKVITVSDITMSCGKIIHPWTFEKRRAESCHDIKWPEWGYPSKESWKDWEIGLKMALVDNNANRLATPLRQWIRYPDRWTWFHKNDSNELLNYDGTSWYKHCEIKSQVRKKSFNIEKKKIEGRVEIRDMIPVTVLNDGSKLNMSPKQEIMKEDNNCEPISESLTFVVEKRGNHSQLLNEIEKGEVIIVSDGSFCPDNKIGTAAWIACSVSFPSIYVIGLVIVPGPKNIMDPYRAELAGVVAAIEYLNMIQSLLMVENADLSIQMYCDGKSVVDKFQHVTKKTCSPNIKHSDIWSVAANLKEEANYRIHLNHVKGHQDDQKDFDDLAFHSKLNVLMDSYAKLFAFQIQRDLKEEEIFKDLRSANSFITPIHDGVTVNHAIKDNLYHSVVASQANQYWIKKQRLTPTAVKLVAWKTQEQAIKQEHSARQRFISKWCVNYIPSGVNLQEWRMRYHSNCPFCGRDKEDKFHVLRCQHSEVQMEWDKKLSIYAGAMQRIDTDTYLLSMIIQKIQQWRNNVPSIFRNTISTSGEIDKVLQAQKKIGWNLFLEGLMAEEMIDYQHEYYKSKSSRKSGTKWGEACIRLNWDLIFAMWENRNKKIHDTDVIDLLEGKEELLRALEHEVIKGKGELPARFHSSFNITMEEMLKKPLKFQKQWFASIRGAREIHRDRHLREDEFTQRYTNPRRVNAESKPIRNPLREWVGLA